MAGQLRIDIALRRQKTPQACRSSAEMQKAAVLGRIGIIGIEFVFLDVHRFGQVPHQRLDLFGQVLGEVEDNFGGRFGPYPGLQLCQQLVRGTQRA